MKKVNEEFLFKLLAVSKSTVRIKNETESEFLKRITHLQLQGLEINAIDELPNCKNVKKAYLQHNLLKNIPDFKYFTQLTHLYLQRNKISKISNLQSLISLAKLYLGYNEIAVIEGFEHVRSLKELHVEFQNLPLGESLHFDPRSVKSLAATLEVLDISGCGLITLSPLRNMKNLQELLASENNLADVEDLTEVLTSWQNLKRIDLSGNPVNNVRNLTDSLIFHSDSLRHVTGKEIHPVTRDFIHGWTRARISRDSRQNISRKSENKKSVHFLKENIQIPFTQPPSGTTSHCTDIVVSAFPPWKIRK